RAFKARHRHALITSLRVTSDGRWGRVGYLSSKRAGASAGRHHDSGVDYKLSHGHATRRHPPKKVQVVLDEDLYLRIETTITGEEHATNSYTWDDSANCDPPLSNADYAATHDARFSFTTDALIDLNLVYSVPNPTSG